MDLYALFIGDLKGPAVRLSELNSYDTAVVAESVERTIVRTVVPRADESLVPPERIESSIYLIRGEKVMLDQDLASLYGVPTKGLVQSVKRNPERFPQDLMFQLTIREFAILRSQIVTSSWGGRRIPPYAFTEQGVAMLSAVLKSSRAVAVNIEIMRTFVRLRRLLLSQEELSRKLLELEERYGRQFKVVFDAIRQMMTPDIPTKRQRIGFGLHES